MLANEFKPKKNYRNNLANRLIVQEEPTYLQIQKDSHSKIQGRF